MCTIHGKSVFTSLEAHSFAKTKKFCHFLEFTNSFIYTSEFKNEILEFHSSQLLEQTRHGRKVTKSHQICDKWIDISTPLCVLCLIIAEGAESPEISLQITNTGYKKKRIGKKPIGIAEIDGIQGLSIASEQNTGKSIVLPSSVPWLGLGRKARETQQVTPV